MTESLPTLSYSELAERYGELLRFAGRLAHLSEDERRRITLNQIVNEATALVDRPGALEAPKLSGHAVALELLPWAVRYAMGRTTYVSGIVSPILVDLGPHLRDRGRYVREIRQADAENALGHDCDRRAWLEAAEALEALDG
jgi:hypothetical protein